jgi:hypothetical protein
MWESDFISSIEGIFKDLFSQADQRAGGGFMDNLTEAKDRVLELTLARAGCRLWGEMKQNARLASENEIGAMRLVVQYANMAKQALDVASKQGWELHIVGHSAGSIFAAYALPLLAAIGVPLRTVQFMAPAIRADLFKQLLLDSINAGITPLPSLYVLSDALECGDSIGPYGKSLLYLVSNAFEGTRGVPILGMQTFIDADPALKKLYAGTLNKRPALIVSSGNPPADMAAAITQGCAASRSHGGFDNDAATMNSVLTRILDGVPTRLFTARDLNY